MHPKDHDKQRSIVVNQIEMYITISPILFTQHYYITYHLICIFLLYYPFWACQRWLCHCFTETLVPRTVSTTKLTNSLLSPWRLHLFPLIKNNINSQLSNQEMCMTDKHSNGHYHSWQYVVLYLFHWIMECTQIMCLMLDCRYDSICTQNLVL